MPIGSCSRCLERGKLNSIGICEKCMGGKKPEDILKEAKISTDNSNRNAKLKKLIEEELKI